MYIVTDYYDHYRPTDTKGNDLVRAKYVKLPVKPMGKGLRALLRKPKGTETFGIWCLLLQAATDTKPTHRGCLLNYKDEPASIEEVADSISHTGQEKLVEKAISSLIEMGWINSVPDTELLRIDSVSATEEPSPNNKDKTTPTTSEVKRSEEQDKEEKPKIVDWENNSSFSLKLGLDLDEKISKGFKPFTEKEVVTFERIRQHLTRWAVKHNTESRVHTIEGMIEASHKAGVKSPKAMFVSLVKKHAGYTGTGVIL